MINKPSDFHRQHDEPGKEKKGLMSCREVCSSASEQALPQFPSCDVERVSAAQTFSLHSKAQLNANQGGTGR